MSFFSSLTVDERGMYMWVRNIVGKLPVLSEAHGISLSNSLLDVPRVLFQKVANAAFDVPNIHEGDS